MKRLSFGLLTTALCLIAPFLATPSFAQTDTTVIRTTASSNGLQLTGLIKDSTTHDPAPFVSLSLKCDSPSSLRSTVTGPDGSFSFTGLDRHLYHLTLSSVGYKSRVVNIDLTDTTRQSWDLGSLSLEKNTKMLKAVSVTAARPVIKQEVDRITYDLQADPDSRSNSVLDMMRKVPFLSLDASNNIMLKGNSNFKIFINGRPSGMLSSNPKEVLNSMPASSIKSIEVITNPPARYDAEGLAGIINIVLIKKESDGITGTLNASEKFPQGGPGAGGSLSAKAGRFGISIIGGGSINNTPSTQISNSRYTFDTPPTSLIQNGHTKTDNKTAYGGAELTYEIDSLHYLFGSFNLFGNSTDGHNDQQSLFTSESTTQGYSYLNRSKDRVNGIDAGLNYQLGFRHHKNTLLTFSYNYRNNHNNQTNTTAISNRINDTLPDYNQYDKSRYSEQTGQIDFVRPGKVTIEAGVKGIFRKNHSDYDYYNLDSTSNEFKIDSASSSAFRNTQNVYSLYNSYNFNINKWAFKAGGRLEETVTDATFSNTTQKVHQNIYNFIPNVAIGYKPDNINAFNFGFSRRIKRPGIIQLNPYVDRSNPGYETTGNPDLKPSIVNSLMLGYGKSGKLNINVGLGYAFFNNMTLQVSEYNPANNITVTTYRNTGKGAAYSSDIYLSYPFTKSWNASLNSNVTYLDLKGTSSGSTIKTNTVMYNINLSNSIRIAKTWRAIVNMTGIGPNVVSLQATSNALFSSSVALSKSLFNDKLSLSATVSNPFTKFRDNRIVTSGADFTETDVNRLYFRQFAFNANFRFGKLKDNSIKKNKRAINNNDLMSNKGAL